MRFQKLLSFALAGVVAASRSHPSTVTSASLATFTEIVNLTSTVTVPSASSEPAPVLVNTTAISVTASTNTTLPSPTGTLAEIASVCTTGAPSVITSIVTQVSTKTIDHFITVTVGGAAPSAGGSKGRPMAGNGGQTSQTTPKLVQAPTTPAPIVTTMASVKPVTTVVVEQTTTVFVTSFVTTTVRVEAGTTKTRTAMVTSTVTSTGMATHTRTRTSTMMITLTKTNTAKAVLSTTKARTTTRAQNTDSTPCPTAPVTLTVTRSASTSKFGIKDDSLTSTTRVRSTTRAQSTSRIQSTTRVRGTTLTETSTRSAVSISLTSSSRVGRTSTTSSRTTVAASQSATSVLPTVSETSVSSTRGGRTRTRTFGSSAASTSVSTVTASSSVLSTGVTTTSSTRRGGRTRTTSAAATLSTAVGTSFAAAETSSVATGTSSASRSLVTSSATASRFSTSIRTNTRSETRSSSAVGATATGDPQTSLTLDPRVVMRNLANDGQDKPEPGQVPSLTSRNNFINFCLTQNVPLTNGQQIKSGSCNNVPMGRILSISKMPASKFVFPPNGATVKANQAFTIRMAIKNLQTGNFVNPTTNYYSAPAQTTEDGTLIGHSHVVVEALTSKQQVTVTDPTKFVFFKGLNQAAVNGILTADVTAGLPAGEYRMSSINSAANHQPALPAVAQRGFNDDIVYFTVA